MSGPKTSRYTLTPEQRRILAQQRELERRKSAASESIKRNNKKLLQIGSMFTFSKQVAAELINRIGNDGGFADKFKELDSITAPISQVILNTNNDDISSLEETAKIVSYSLAAAEKFAAELTQISSLNEVKLQTSLNTDIDKGVNTSFADIKSETITTFSENKNNIHSKLIQMKNNLYLPENLKIELEKAICNLVNIENEEFLKNYFSVTITPLLKRCNQFLEEYESCHEEFEKLNTEYKAICSLYYYIAQDYPCCHDSIDKLKTEIQRIKNEVDEDDEQTYINMCLDKVMEEMGYIVIGSREVTKKNGKHFRNELYTYNEGTAVNVTYSSDGKIAMELGGIDTIDRLPNDYETPILCESMSQFCDDFKEIEKRLLAKGVILADRISSLPPCAEYAQIINTTDYQMTKNYDKLQVKTHNKSTTKLKAMRRE